MKSIEKMKEIINEKFISIEEMQKREKMIKNHLILSERESLEKKEELNKNIKRIILNQFFLIKDDLMGFRYEIYIHYSDSRIKRIYKNDNQNDSLKKFREILKENLKKEEEKKEEEKIS